MGIQNWSDQITVVELSEDPQFSDDLGSLMDGLTQKPAHVILNFGALGFINSSNVAKLLKLRKELLSHQRRLIFCGVTSPVWGVFQVTGLDKIFEFTNDMATALAMLQMTQGKSNSHDHRGPKH